MDALLRMATAESQGRQTLPGGFRMAELMLSILASIGCFRVPDKIGSRLFTACLPISSPFEPGRIEVQHGRHQLVGFTGRPQRNGLQVCYTSNANTAAGAAS
jgi:hypothetical protein